MLDLKWILLGEFETSKYLLLYSSYQLRVDVLAYSRVRTSACVLFNVFSIFHPLGMILQNCIEQIVSFAHQPPLWTDVNYSAASRLKLSLFFIVLLHLFFGISLHHFFHLGPSSLNGPYRLQLSSWTPDLSKHSTRSTGFTLALKSTSASALLDTVTFIWTYRNPIRVMEWGD